MCSQRHSKAYAKGSEKSRNTISPERYLLLNPSLLPMIELQENIPLICTMCPYSVLQESRYKLFSQYELIMNFFSVWLYSELNAETMCILFFIVSSMANTVPHTEFKSYIK